MENCEPQGGPTITYGVSQLLGPNLNVYVLFVLLLHLRFLLPQNENHYKFGHGRETHNEENLPHFLSSCVFL